MYIVTILYNTKKNIDCFKLTYIVGCSLYLTSELGVLTWSSSIACKSTIWLVSTYFNFYAILSLHIFKRVYEYYLFIASRYHLPLLHLFHILRLVQQEEEKHTPVFETLAPCRLRPTVQYELLQLNLNTVLIQRPTLSPRN